MSLKTRALVFVTFFGNCIVIGLLLASLNTNYWIQSTAKSNKTNTSNGSVNFGLFAGHKYLNLGIGMRLHPINVINLVKTEPDVMNYWLWLGAALGVGFGLFSSAIGAIASVLKSASFSKKRGTMILIIISNVASAISQMLAFVCWLVQFYQYLKHNVLVAADRQMEWSTTGMAQLGHSFFFVAAGIIVVTINLILIFTAIVMERREKRIARSLDPAYDEKIQGAIMLY